MCRVRLPEQAGRPASARIAKDIRPAEKWVQGDMHYARPYLRGFAMSSLSMREIRFSQTLQQQSSITRRVIYTRYNVHTVSMEDG